MSELQTPIPCPHCAGPQNFVVDSRKHLHAVRRRRECKDCHGRWTTYEMSEQHLSQLVGANGAQKTLGDALAILDTMRIWIQNEIAGTPKHSKPFSLPRGNAKISRLPDEPIDFNPTGRESDHHPAPSAAIPEEPHHPEPSTGDSTPESKSWAIGGIA